MLKQDSPRLQAILTNLPQVVLCVQADGVISYVNHPEAGYSIEQVLGTSIFDFVPQDVQSEFRVALDRAIRNGETTQIETPSWKVNGEIVYYDCQFLPLVEERVTPAALLVATNISARKQMELQFAESKLQNEEALSWFKLLSDQSNDAHLFVDRDGRIRYVNQRACEMLQYSEQELLQLRVYDIAPGSEVRVPLFFQQMSHRVPPFEAIYLRKDGTEFPVEISLTPTMLSGEPHLCAAVRDVSERKTLQKQLQKSQKEVRDFRENATVGMHWVGPDGTMLWANQRELEMLGYSKAEYIGQ
ncbi:MAG: PAS domain S-box protein, partial [Planctomycetaceae bacterium]|nr:PAS domain S-box protein [Planctomycetaceae bacterium]